MFKMRMTGIHVIVRIPRAKAMAGMQEVNSNYIVPAVFPREDELKGQPTEVEGGCALIWMCGVRFCFVSGKDHRANDRHSRDKVLRAVQNLEEKLRKAFLTFNDMAYVASLTKAPPAQ